jgi:hypothetical protein
MGVGGKHGGRSGGHRSHHTAHRVTHHHTLGSHSHTFGSHSHTHHYHHYHGGGGFGRPGRCSADVTECVGGRPSPYECGPLRPASVPWRAASGAFFALSFLAFVGFLAGTGVVFSAARVPSRSNLPPRAGQDVAETTCVVEEGGWETTEDAGVGEHGGGCWAVRVASANGTRYPWASGEAGRVLTASLFPPPQNPLPPCSSFVGREFACVYARRGVVGNASEAQVCPGTASVAEAEVAGPSDVAPWRDPEMLGFVDPWVLGWVWLASAFPAALGCVFAWTPRVRWVHNRCDVFVVSSAVVLVLAAVGGSLFGTPIAPYLRRAWFDGLANHAVASTPAAELPSPRTTYAPERRECALLATRWDSASSSCNLYLSVGGMATIAVAADRSQAHVANWGLSACLTMTSQAAYRPYADAGGAAPLSPTRYWCWVVPARAAQFRDNTAAAWRRCPDRSPFLLRDPVSEQDVSPANLGNAYTSRFNNDGLIIGATGKEWLCPGSASSCGPYVVDDDATPSSRPRAVRPREAPASVMPSDTTFIRIAEFADASGLTAPANLSTYPLYPSKSSAASTADEPSFLNGQLAIAAYGGGTVTDDDAATQGLALDDFLQPYLLTYNRVWLIAGLTIGNAAIFFCMPLLIRCSYRARFLCDTFSEEEIQAILNPPTPAPQNTTEPSPSDDPPSASTPFNPDAPLPSSKDAAPSTPFSEKNFLADRSPSAPPPSAPPPFAPLPSAPPPMPPAMPPAMPPTSSSSSVRDWGASGGAVAERISPLHAYPGEVAL